MTKKFVVFDGRKFYSPYRCLCCGEEISEKQFCYGRLCPYCDCGRCCDKGGYERGHGRKDIFESAEKLGDELQEIVKEKIEKIKDEK